MDDWIEVRRVGDAELLGFVQPWADGWRALTVFGGLLGTWPSVAEARRQVEAEGLTSLARHWHLRRRGTADWEVMLILEAWPGRARVAIGWYSLPGTETFTITASDLAAGDELRLDPPD